MLDNFTGNFELRNHPNSFWKPGGCWLPTQSQCCTDWVESAAGSVS